MLEITIKSKEFELLSSSSKTGELHLLSQFDCSNLVRDLELSNSKSQLVDSKLQPVRKSNKELFFRKRHSQF